MPKPLSQVLRRLHEEATPGDWSVLEKQKTYGDKSFLVHNAAGWVIAETPALAPFNPAGVRDAELIVTLRNALPALAEVARLEALIVYQGASGFVTDEMYAEASAIRSRAK